MADYRDIETEFPALVGLVPWSAAWLARYRDEHAARYPDADQGTRDNLAMLVERAERREQG